MQPAVELPMTTYQPDILDLPLSQKLMIASILLSADCMSGILASSGIPDKEIKEINSQYTKAVLGIPPLENRIDDLLKAVIKNEEISP